MADDLTPAQARAHFGDLTAEVGSTRVRVHREFETDEGVWRVVFDGAMRLEGYRLYPVPRAGRGVVYRPKKR